MGKNNILTIEQCEVIIYYYQYSNSYQIIAETVNRKMLTIHDIIKQFHNIELTKSISYFRYLSLITIF